MRDIGEGMTLEKQIGANNKLFNDTFMKMEETIDSLKREKIELLKKIERLEAKERKNG
jgi:2-hydroxy-3-keto-5-methylthiopentenyl-1-phosphate phosphatase